MKNKLIIFYAPNINGLGAKVWLEAKIKQFKKKNFKYYLFINDKNLIKFSKSNIIKLKNLNRFNFFYLLFAKFIIKQRNFDIHVMGDYPLPFIKNQTLYINQANLINPIIYKYSRSDFLFSFKRLYFRIFLNNTKKIIVQSKFMKKYLNKSYSFNNKIFIDQNFSYKKLELHRKIVNKNKIKILYPSSMYDYKNHQIVVDLLKTYIVKNINFYFTCSKKEFEPYKNIRNLYRINYFENTNLEKVYNQYDAIIFPSLIESLGLPIIEATKMKMPIIVSNLPYSREISSSYIKYFNPKSVKSLYKTIYNLFLS
jgi:hypothetical protein